ncbi:methyl-accepting chemotaxis protein [Domibacillus indicus]|uniref:methyl-accepting chemotaxis protein n=1 Tax=Domibacillus indicus TaxID=1437523 RepID=UPI0006183555|nr:methyl-accepting chemotaxis protein [Domibacillus indicus]
MTAIESLRVRDTGKKNTLMYIVFSISLLFGLGKAFSIGELDKAAFYGTELVIFSIMYFVLQKGIKKPFLFPYAGVGIIYLSSIFSIFLFGASAELVIILLFLVLISSVHLQFRVFILGYTLGLAGMIMAAVFNTDETQTIDAIFPVAMIVYILSGIVLGVVISLTSKQFAQLGEFIARIEEETKQKEEQKQKLEVTVSGMIEDILQADAHMKSGLAAQSEMKTAIQEIAAGSQTQAEQINKVVLNTSSTKASMEHFHRVSTELRAESGQAGEIVKEGQQQVKGLNDDIQQAKSISLELNETFDSLSGTIQEMNELTSMIQDITDQTGLLALNASIEAARAGQYGKGFSVVASEIRKLADVTKETTQKINDKLQRLNQSNSRALEKVDESHSYIDRGVASTEQVTASFEQVRNILLYLNDEVVKFAALSESVTKETGAIEASTTELAAIIEQSSASLEEMTATIENVTDDNETIAALMSETSSKAEQLKNTFS